MSTAFLKNFMEQRNRQEAALKEKYGDDFERPVRKFELNRAEQAVIDAWLESLKPEIMELQKKSNVSDLAKDEPYYGAIGGGVTISFTSTGLGDIITAKETITGKELNVSDALGWYFFG